MAAVRPRGPIVTLTPNPALDLSTATETVLPNRKLRCTAARIDPGGGGINVSRVARRLGSRTCAVFVAGGPTGARLVSALDGEGIDTACFEVPEDTRESVTVTETSTGDLFRFVLPGSAISREAADGLLDCFAGRLAPGVVGVGSGSLPGGIADDFWARAARRAREADALFVLDSSTGVAAALEVGVGVLRLNKDEFADFAGRDIAWPEEAADWCERLVADGSARTVIVTHGADGAVLVGPEGRLAVRPPAVKAESAVGAGDSFVAGLVHAMASGMSQAEALRLATVSAAAALMTAGTELARKSDIDRLLEEAPPTRTLPRRGG